MITIAFFNNKGGVGKTSLVSHLAWMMADLGTKVVVADLDPQANLTSFFVREERLERIWADERHSQTVFGAMKPIIDGVGDIAHPHLEMVEERIGLIAGDLALSLCEDELNREWPQCLNRSVRAYRVISAFGRMMRSAGKAMDADIGLIDVGPNLGAINRAALIAADYVVVPLAPDIYSLQGLTNLGTRLKEWRKDWNARYREFTSTDFQIPTGRMSPLGYVIMKHTMRLDRPVKAYDFWMTQIPPHYADALGAQDKAPVASVEQDANCLAMLKDYRSLMPTAQRLHKPMFRLRNSDGVFGANSDRAEECRADFEALARRVLMKIQSDRLQQAARIMGDGQNFAQKGATSAPAARRSTARA